MASRNLTDIFHLMRNNAIQRLHMFSDQMNNRNGQEEDKVSLVPRRARKGFEIDLEKGEIELDETVTYSRAVAPPDWVNTIPEFREQIDLLRQEIKELNLCHDKHLTRPALLFDDNEKSQEEERIIEQLSEDLTRKLHQLQRQAETYRKRSQSFSSKQEERLLKNIILSIVSELQEVTTEFRQSQSAYLARMRQREQQSEQYFGSRLTKSSPTGLFSDRYGIEDHDDAEDVTVFQRGNTGLTSQLQIHEENVEMARHRERQITEVVKSITELNEIFNDLSMMVVEQGTVVDRIDYNVDRAAGQTAVGLQQLQKAENYQRKNRKFICIVFLAVVIVFLMIILIVVKS
ncbi:syntaxin-16-like [Paramacrobiotus metropolitanus]|uniref:syntaxin-16-like n=1 Tax=Paramacrobiotus metropolitanus TaxID=2943436 RepID=UPI002445BBDA|nr:syntaxin-16-like [Paramacrobiotus metropolitanus]XP_055329365.1 syntaxin-16-like [Paramacrobiotus metropolitanus]